MIKNKVLLILSILPKELTHLYGLVTKDELNDLNKKNKIDDFYKFKKEELTKLNQYDLFYKNLKFIKDKFKDDLIIVNQELDSILDNYEIEYISLNGNFNNFVCLDCNEFCEVNSKICPSCESNKLFYNIRLKDENSQFKELIEHISKCQYTVMIGEMGQVDPTLFIDEMVDSLYLGIKEIKYNGNNPYLDKEFKDYNLSQFFSKSLIVENYDKAILNLNEFLNSYLGKSKKVDIHKPYKNNGKEILDIINNYYNHLIDKYNISENEYDKKIIRELRQSFPFVKNIPNVYLYNIWLSFCHDIKINYKETNYNDMFYDMLLVYAYYRWDGVKKFYTTRPKVSLALAYNENNDLEINIFKKQLLKNNFI